jgi:hypothetical protein
MHELFMMYMLVSINGAIRLSLCVQKKKKSIFFKHSFYAFAYERERRMKTSVLTAR